MSHLERSRVVPALLETNPAATSYSGPVDDVTGLARGKGRATYEDGSEYEGAFIDGARHGFGTLLLAEDESDEDADDDSVDRQRARYAGSWSEDEPHGHGEQISSDGCVLKGTFHRGELVGDVVMTAEDGETKRYVGGLDEYGAYTGCGSEMSQWAGRGCLTAFRERGELVPGIALWQEEIGDCIGVLAWTRASFGRRTRSWSGDLCCERGGVCVEMSEDTRRDPRLFVEQLNARTSLILAGGASFRGLLTDVKILLESRDAGELIRSLQVSRMQVEDGSGIISARRLTPGQLVGYYSGRSIHVGGVHQNEAESLAQNAVMLYDGAGFDWDTVTSHDEETSVAAKCGVRLIKLDKIDASVNLIRVENKEQTNCERVYVEMHPLLGESVCVHASRVIETGETCMVSPDYFMGWCLEPKSEAGYYVSMWSYPVETILDVQNDIHELGRVRVLKHGCWRALYLGKVEQGLTYIDSSGCPDPRVLGFQYIRVMVRAAIEALCASVSSDTSRLSVLAVGLGTGAIPMFLANHTFRDGLRCDVTCVERSQAVIDACAFLGVRMVQDGRHEREKRPHNVKYLHAFRVIRADGLKYLLKECGHFRTHDVILLDAYDGEGRVPPHMRSFRFVEAVKKSLAKRGSVICNCWNDRSGTAAAIELEKFSEMLHRHVGRVKRLTVEGQENNIVLVGKKRSH